jgi:hypothetical protein
MTSAGVVKRRIPSVWREEARFVAVRHGNIPQGVPPNVGLTRTRLGNNSAAVPISRRAPNAVTKINHDGTFVDFAQMPVYEPFSRKHLAQAPVAHRIRLPMPRANAKQLASPVPGVGGGDLLAQAGSTLRDRSGGPAGEWASDRARAAVDAYAADRSRRCAEDSDREQGAPWVAQRALMGIS